MHAGEEAAEAAEVAQALALDGGVSLARGEAVFVREYEEGRLARSEALTAEEVALIGAQRTQRMQRRPSKRARRRVRPCQRAISRMWRLIGERCQLGAIRCQAALTAKEVTQIEAQRTQRMQWWPFKRARRQVHPGPQLSRRCKYDCTLSCSLVPDSILSPARWGRRWWSGRGRPSTRGTEATT